MVDRSSGERVVVVTGVGRPAGIGFAIARRLLGDGAEVLCHTFGEEGEGAAAELRAVDLGAAEPGEASERLRFLEADLGEPDAPGRVIGAALDAFRAVDGLVVNHAHSSDQSLATVSAAELDRAWAVNARAAVLLAQAFAARHDDERPDGRIVFLTSGQHLGPMPGELPYVLSKAAVQGATRTLADELAERGITVNAVNPGPVDTGWPSAELRERLRPAFPSGRWGRAADIAPVVAWLLSAESAWVTGQVIDAEGGFRRQAI
jgi:3-oxoacyl-[acyl-carrier protein] reductase